VEEVNSKIKNFINEAHNNGIIILVFPEMVIDLNYKEILYNLVKLSEQNNIYIIPGSYHDKSIKKNISVVISPNGIQWQQQKRIPATINFESKRFVESIITGTFPKYIMVCNTEYGRIAIAICRDFLDMDFRVELKNFEPPVDIVINPAFTPVTADFKAVHFDARRSIYAYCLFANVAEFGDSLTYTTEKEKIERTIPAKKEGVIFKEIDLFKLRVERQKWEKEQLKERKFIQSTRI
jgi:predicted amidohydrolase